MATSEKYGDKETTQWHKIVAWQKLAEICGKYLSKGQEVLVQGKIVYRDWEGKDGKKNYSTEIHIDKMEFIGPKPGGQKAGPAEDAGDLPF